MSTTRAPERIAVLGGGMAAMAAVWQLTSRPDWRERYDITVYQQGWRIGGKGASGRNRAHADRIEEHGLHVWLGFYDNAFRVMRECYAELGREPGEPLATWRDAFKPHHFIVNQERVGDDWRPHALEFPPNDRVPGDEHDAPSTLDYARTIIGQTLRMYLRVRGRDLPGAALRLAQKLLSTTSFERLARYATTLRLLVGRFVGAVRAELPKHLADDDTSRRLWIGLDLLGTLLKGLIVDGLLLPNRDFSELDDEDFRAWLRRHGASAATVDCAPVRALYDLVFSREAGLAAGATLLSALRMLFDYKGAIFWTMQAGMGDVVFAPLYLCLKQRGVRFAFFHRVDRLHTDGQRVTAIDIGRQVDAPDYHPLFDVKGLPCWPSEPLWEQLADGDAIRAGGHDLESFWCRWPDRERVRLEVGRDFERVLFGISIGAMPYLCQDLLACSKPLRDMVEHTSTIKTQALQLWLQPGLRELGWTTKSPIMSAFARPFDTWADLSHLLSVESWPGDGPKKLAYFCGALEEDVVSAPRADAEFPERERERAKAHAVRWIEAHVGHLWPAAVDRQRGFRWELLEDPAERDGRARFEAQYWRANVNPSDRFVQSVPGSLRYRLLPDESGFDNLVLAGDWVRTRLNASCIEGATMAGLAAARALSGDDVRIFGDFVERPKARRSVKTPPLPRYIDRGGELVSRGPYMQEHTLLAGYLLPARLASLQALVDRCLNEPCGEPRYRAIAPFVALMCADIKRLWSLDPRDRQRGTTTERDVGFWVPLAAGDRLVWFLPYLFVDNAFAVATGREVYGFHKQVADIVMPDPRGEGSLEVRAMGFERFDLEARATALDVLKVERVTSPLAPAPALAHNLASVSARAIDLLTHGATPKLAADIARSMTSGQLRVVFLQQLRDVEDMTRASYQAVIEAPSTITARRGSGFLGGAHVVTLRRAESHPIVSDLGLPGHEVQASYGFWLDFDFTMDHGEVIRARGRGRASE